MSFFRDRYQGVGAIAAEAQSPRSAPAPTISRIAARDYSDTPELALSRTPQTRGRTEMYPAVRVYRRSGTRGPMLISGIRRGSPPSGPEPVGGTTRRRPRTGRPAPRPTTDKPPGKPSRTPAFARSELALIGQFKAQYDVLRPIGRPQKGPQKGPQSGKGRSQRPVTPAPQDYQWPEVDEGWVEDRGGYGGGAQAKATQTSAQAVDRGSYGGGAQVKATQTSAQAAAAPSQRYDSEFDDEALDELDSPGPIREADAPPVAPIAPPPPRVQLAPAPAKKSNFPLLLIGGGVLALLLLRK